MVSGTCYLNTNNTFGLVESEHSDTASIQVLSDFHAHLFPPQKNKALLLSCFSLASTGSIFVSINKARDEIWCHCYNKCICDNWKNSNAFQNPIPDACSTRTACLLQEKQEPKCLKYCMIWNSFPHCTRCFYVVFIQESLIKKTFSYWKVRPHHCESYQRKIRYTHWFNEALNCPWNFARNAIYFEKSHLNQHEKKVFFCASINYSIELIFLQIMSVVYTMYGCCRGLCQNPHCSHSKL